MSVLSAPRGVVIILEAHDIRCRWWCGQWCCWWCGAGAVVDGGVVVMLVVLGPSDASSTAWTPGQQEKDDDEDDDDYDYEEEEEVEADEVKTGTTGDSNKKDKEEPEKVSERLLG